MQLVGLVLLLILPLLAAGLQIWSRKTRAKYPPGPMSLPFIGHLHLLSAPLYRTFSRLAPRYGPLMYLRIGSAPVVVASSPEIVAEIFKNNDITFSSRPLNVATLRLSYGRLALPFTPYGPNWAFSKKITTSELLGSELAGRIRTRELHRLIRDMLEKSRSGEAVNFTWEVLKMARNTMSQMLMGKRMYADPGEAGEVEELIRGVIRVGVEVNSSLFNVLGLWKSLDIGGHLKRLEDIFHRFDALLEKTITAREEVRRKSKRDGARDDQDRDFLNVLLDLMEDDSTSNIRITRDYIKATFLDTLVAGTESSAVVLDWALAELMNHPDIMKKAHTEVDEVVGKSRIVDASDNKHLTYIQAIVKETLRLHAPIPIMTLKSSKECQINDFTIPSDTILFVNVWGIGRDPKVWDNSLEFRPERFTDDSLASSNIDVRGRHYQLLPFGTGKRSCPAANSSMQGLTTALATIIQCFDFKLKGEVIDMSEKVLYAGPGAPRLKPLECFPIARFTPKLLEI